MLFINQAILISIKKLHKNCLKKNLLTNVIAQMKSLTKKTNSIALESANPAYETKIFNPERVKIQGILVSLYRNF